MAKQDDFIRITLRLPPELHAKLIEAAGPRSLNAEIVDRLSKSLRNEVTVLPADVDQLLLRIKYDMTTMANLVAKETAKETLTNWLELQNRLISQKVKKSPEE